MRIHIHIHIPVPISIYIYIYTYTCIPLITRLVDLAYHSYSLCFSFNGAPVVRSSSSGSSSSSSSSGGGGGGGSIGIISIANIITIVIMLMR